MTILKPRKHLTRPPELPEESADGGLTRGEAQARAIVLCTCSVRLSGRGLNERGRGISVGEAAGERRIRAGVGVPLRVSQAAHANPARLSYRLTASGAVV